MHKEKFAQILSIYPLFSPDRPLFVKSSQIKPLFLQKIPSAPLTLANFSMILFFPCFILFPSRSKFLSNPEFQVPYCPSVEADQAPPTTDGILEQIEESIERLSEQIDPWHQHFRNDFFSDLGFSLAGLFLGRLPAVRQKFSMVKEILETGQTTRRNRHLDSLKDPF